MTYHSTTMFPRTPVKTGVKSPKTTPENQAEIKKTTPSHASPSVFNVRRSIGEWEGGKVTRTDQKTKPQDKAVTLVFSPPAKTTAVDPPIRRPEPANRTYTKPQQSKMEIASTSAKVDKYKDKVTEAKACLQKANISLANSRNIKTELKKDIQAAVDRLYQLVKEAVTDGKIDRGQMGQQGQGNDRVMTMEMGTMTDGLGTWPEAQRRTEGEITDRKDDDLRRKLDEHALLIKESCSSIEKLKEALGRHQEELVENRRSYAGVTAGRTGAIPPPIRATLHSVVVTAKNTEETGDEVLTRVRNVLNAKEGDIEIERVRKARDRKVIIGCRTEGEREKVKERIRKDQDNLKVDDITNKNPMVQIAGVLKVHTNDDIYKALRNQNRRVFEGLNEEDSKMEMAYRIQGRNPLTNKIVLRVAPKLWGRLTDLGTVRIDLQPLQVIDKSPLVQCTQCLGYGHSKRLCTETQVRCSHCGGQHTKARCPEFQAGESPTCINCLRAKRQDTMHNAFDDVCAIRTRWDELARAAVAYC